MARVGAAWVMAAVGAAVLAGAGGVARGDGKAFSAATYDAASIPAQRAILAWRDGVETLVVESHVVSRSPEVAWVLPLPAEPTSLGIADPGTLTSAALCLAPRLIDDLRSWRNFVWLLGGLLLPPAAVTLCLRDPLRRQRVRSRLLVAEFLLLVLAVAMFGPGLSGLESPTAAAPVSETGVSLLGARRVGNYETAVLDARDANSLDAYLRENGFGGLDAGDRAVVTDYLVLGWRMMVARLAKDANSALPHPIVATFPSDVPVYPMRLTGQSHAPTRVELFVIADRQVEAEHFTRIAADRFTLQEGTQFVGSHYAGSRGDLFIGSPDLAKWMWDGCVVTALRGRLNPGQMDRDVRLRPVDAPPYRARGFSPAAVRDLSLTVAGGGAVLGLVGAMVLTGRRRRSPRAPLAVATCVLLVLGAAGVVRLVVPGEPVRRGRFLHQAAAEARIQRLDMGVAKLAVTGLLPDPLTPDTAERIPSLLADAGLMREVVNPFTGEPMRMERSPGNYSLQVINGRAEICLYDTIGRRRRLEAFREQANRQE